MQIFFSFPKVVTHNFKSADGIEWRNNEDDFKRWCGRVAGLTVDAGMRQLNETGYMHNCGYRS
jgi:deoxyribodipyrimidine photo-lyase